MLDAAGGGGHVRRRILRFEVRVREPGQEIILIGVEREVGAEVGDRRAKLVRRQLANSHLRDESFQTLAEDLGRVAERRLLEETRANLGTKGLELAEPVGHEDFLEGAGPC